MTSSLHPKYCLIASSDFVRSGNVNLDNGSLRNFGRNGNGWSNTAAVYGVGTWAASAYNLKFDPVTVYPSYGPNARWNGFPVRLFRRGSVPIFILCRFLVQGQEIKPAPAFVRSGNIGLNYSSLRYLGRNGFVWSSINITYSTSTSATAYLLSFNISGINTSGGLNNRWDGLPVRCLVYKLTPA